MTTTDRRRGLSGAVAVKAPVRAASTGSLTLAGLQSVDGVALADGDRVLVKNQASPTENGIYSASTGSWTRAPDFDGAYDCVTGTTVFVVGGSANGGEYWYVSTPADPSPGTAMAFTQAPVAAGSTTAAGVSYDPAASGMAAVTVQAGIDELRGLKNQARGTTIASAATCDIMNGTSDFIEISGTTTITRMATATGKYNRATVTFQASLTLTHDSTFLILPTGANVTTQSGDTAVFVRINSNKVRCVSYTRASGAALSGAGGIAGYPVVATLQGTDRIAIADASNSNADSSVSLSNFLAGITDGYSNGGYIADRVYHAFGYFAHAPAAVTANKLYCHPFPVGQTETFTAIGLRVAASVPTDRARVGIFNFSGGLPTTLVLDCGEINCGSNGDRTATISLLLPKGIYAVGAVFNGTPTMVPISAQPGIGQHFFGATDGSSFDTVGVAMDHAYGALPASFTLTSYINSGSGANIFLKKS